jgi:putative DNA primase/helicase
LRAEIHFDKGRGLYGDDAKPFEVRLQSNTEGAADWTMRSVEDVTFNRASELYNEGQSVRDVAEALSISKSKAGRLRARWKANELPA